MWLNEDICWAADHHEMLHVVPPYQEEPATAIDAGRVDDGKSRLSTTCAAIVKTFAPEPPQDPERECQQPKNDYEGDYHLQGVLAFAEQHVEHYLFPTAAAADPL
jgi:hypothetical protein